MSNPMCSSCIYFGYDEIWDGEEETGYFYCDKGNYNHIGWNKELWPVWPENRLGGNRMNHKQYSEIQHCMGVLEGLGTGLRRTAARQPLRVLRNGVSGGAGMSVNYARINNTLGKFYDVLSNHSSVCVSISGGSDSDIIIHIICTYFREFLPKVHFIFANTGIEYRATLRHLDYLRKRYGIQIDEVRGMPIPIAVQKYGVPFVSKKFSEYLGRLQKHHFAWEDGSMLDLWAKYPNAKVGIRFWTNDWGENSRYNIDWVKGLKEFMMWKKPQIKFSSECCIRSKKAPLVKIQKQYNADLYITGERKCEGGARVGAHKSCFEEAKKNKVDHFIPLWFWDNETKAYYKKHEGIKNSDCYEVWGMKRTGCVGCPYGRDLWAELKIIKQYEPQCYKLCTDIFGESYKLRKEFEEFRAVKAVEA